MSLKVERKTIDLEGPFDTGGSSGDDWGTRIAKLIPAEALGLYGTAIALIQTPSASARLIALWVIVAVCCALTIVIRYRATLDPVTKKPSWIEIGIALVSFILWLTALGGPTSPISLPADFAFAGPLAAMLWGTIVPYRYRG